MDAILLPTYYAPAEKAEEHVLHAQHDKFTRLGLVRLLLDGFPEGAVVLNSQRQIVFANDKVASFLSSSRDALVGQRLGAALNCVHAHEHPAGCGTTTACRYCGAAQAMEASRLNRTKEVRECRILLTEPLTCSALDLRVWTTPLELDGETFTILALRDIADEKRRQLLERIFFHDIMNLAGGIRGVLELLPGLSDARAVEFEQMAAFQAEQLVEEIECQRDLSAAERGDLAVHFKPVAIHELLERICFLYNHHPVAEGKTLRFESVIGHDTLHTDPIMLRRTLGNLIKNALEASQVGETVRVRSCSIPNGRVFAVNNPAVLDEAVRAQIFQRSFSTKPGTGRGLGSYSVKLITERYLKGRVEFDSIPGQGTTFRILLPDRSTEGSEKGIESTPHHNVKDTVSTAAQASLSPLRILLAEDNLVNRQVALGMLRKWGQIATLATNGREVLAALDREVFDLILMDVQMPEMDGFETTNRIRTREQRVGGHVSIVAMTAHAMQGDKERCLAAGMDDYLSKPIESADLYAVLNRVRETVHGPEGEVLPPSDEPKIQRHSVGEAQLQKPILNPEAIARLRSLADDGGTSFLAMVVEAFLQDSKRRLADLRDAVAIGDPDGLRKSAHALKGAGGEIGALRVTETCQSLEDLGGNHTMEGAGDLVARLNHDLEDVHSELQRQSAQVPS